MAKKVLIHYFNFQFAIILIVQEKIRFQASRGTHLQSLNSCHPQMLTCRDEVLLNQDPLLM